MVIWRLCHVMRVHTIPIYSIYASLCLYIYACWIPCEIRMTSEHIVNVVQAASSNYRLYIVFYTTTVYHRCVYAFRGWDGMGETKRKTEQTFTYSATHIHKLLDRYTHTNNANMRCFSGNATVCAHIYIERMGCQWGISHIRVINEYICTI